MRITLAVSTILAAAGIAAACAPHPDAAASDAGAATGSAAGGIADRPAGSSAAAGAATAGRDSAHVTVGKAPFAGSYAAAGAMNCVMYGGTWQATLERDGDRGLTAVQVMLKEIPAQGGSADRVHAALQFGRPDEGRAGAGLVDLMGAETGGDARGSVAREGRGATLRLEGTSPQGGRVTMAIRCATVELLQ